MHPLDEAAFDGPPPVEGAVIAGTVTDFSGFPLVGVRVEAATSGGADLDLLPVMTDGQGGFELHGLAEGRYDLRFELGRVKARVLGVPSGKQDLPVRLARPQGVLLVVKTVDGEPLPSLLHVLLEREAKGARIREYMGRHFESRLLLWSIRPGTYHVTVWGGHYVPVTAHTVEVREGVGAPEVELLLTERGATVTGAVLDGTGQPLAGSLVGWRRLDGPILHPRHLATATTGGDGRFLVPGLPAGRYRLSAGPADGPFADLEVDVDGDGTFDVELRLPA